MTVPRGTPPTERQAEVLEAIVELTRRKGYPPSLRELGARVGLRSTNGVRDILVALERKGLLRFEARKSRSLRVIGSSQDPTTREEMARVLGDLAVAPDCWCGRGDRGCHTGACAAAARLMGKLAVTTTES